MWNKWSSRAHLKFNLKTRTRIYTQHHLVNHAVKDREKMLFVSLIFTIMFAWNILNSRHSNAFSPLKISYGFFTDSFTIRGIEVAMKKNLAMRFDYKWNGDSVHLVTFISIVRHNLRILRNCWRQCRIYLFECVFGSLVHVIVWLVATHNLQILSLHSNDDMIFAVWNKKSICLMDEELTSLTQKSRWRTILVTYLYLFFFFCKTNNISIWNAKKHLFGYVTKQ